MSFRSQFAALAAVIIAAAALFTSCGEKPVEAPVADAPELLGVSPADGTADLVATSLDVVFTYDCNVKIPLSRQSEVTVSNSATVDKVVAYNTAVTVSVSGLRKGESYTVTIPEGVVSGFSDNPAGAASTTFSIKADEPDYGRKPSSSLTDPDASATAKKLYAYLLGIYGSRSVSGAMGGTAWETSYTDNIASLTGIYPGIVGFDYLFLNWPAKAWDGCPDYGDITPVKTAWEAGNIIQIGWHWSVPDSKGQTDLNKYSYSTKAFGVENALKEGTWQHEVMESQIEKLAGYMKLLQDAGIPVLFRPLHEAAGDYGWNAWFWWGYDGADACVRLWKHLRDRLQNTYGLHNLIWVWTVQTKNFGVLSDDPSQARAWYPGDEYVDIVGADLYEEKGVDMSSFFRYVNNSVKGAKMVALSEFGNLPDLSGCFASDAPWLYYMNWCNFEDGKPILYSKNSDGTYGWNNSVPEWTAILKNELTVNRGDIRYE